MAPATKGWNPTGDNALLWEFLPGDHSRQVHSMQQVQTTLKQLSAGDTPLMVLDLGCGNGNTFQSLTSLNHRIRWIGLDIPDSPEANGGFAGRFPICAFDGVHIPLLDNSIDLVYSHQVFEHVRHPKPLLSEVLRVLKVRGRFVGSTSHLEPYHSRSFWNYTPFGFCSLLRDTGFGEITVRPGIDGMSLVARRLLALARFPKFFELFFTLESPLNVGLEAALRVLRIGVERRNAVKLLFAGQFCFDAVKLAGPAS